jgi:hypothetical protein
MRLICALIAEAIVFNGVGAATAAGQFEIPASVQNEVAEFEKECPSDYVRGTSTIIVRKKIRELKEPLIVLDVARLPSKCGFDGSAGNPLVIYGLIGGEWVKTYDSVLAVRGYRFARRAGKTAVELDLHGGYCGGFGSDKCRETLVFDGRIFLKHEKK